MACTNITLRGLTQDCSSSKGGIKKAYIAAYKEDEFTISGGTVTAVASGVTFYDYAFRKNTGTVTETLNVDLPNGVNYVSSEINLVFTKQDTTKRVEMAALALGDLMLVIMDANGNYKAYGIENPVVASAGAGETGTNVSDGNKYTITLTDEQSSFAPFLTTAAVAELLALVAQPNA